LSVILFSDYKNTSSRKLEIKISGNLQGIFQRKKEKLEKSALKREQKISRFCRSL
jgi:hypothetical protein